MTLNQITKVKGPGIHTQANIVSNSISLGGIATASNFKTGTTNVHNVGIEIAGINVLGADTPIGTGSTIYDAGGAVFTGVVTATSFSGSIAGTADLASGLTGTPDIAVRNITGVGATFTGNVSIGGTLTYEDVTNIDSVGVITARDGIILGGGNISLADRPDGNSQNLFFGTGAKAATYHDGTNFTVINNTGHTYIGVGAANKDLMLYAQSTGNIILQRNTGHKYFEGVGSDGTAKIYHNTNEKIRTTSTGAIVTGILTATGNVDIAHGSGQAHYQITQTNGNTVKMGIVSGSDFEISGSSNNDIILKRAGSTRLTITTDGATVAPNLTANTVVSNYGGITTRLGFVSGGAEGVVETTTNHSLVLGTNSTERLRITTAGHLEPGANTTYHCGSPSKRWSSIYGQNLSLTSYASIGSIVAADPGSAYYAWNNRIGSGLAVAGTTYLNGSVGIGTDNPADILHLQSTAPILKVDATNDQSGLRIDVLGQTGGGNNQLFRVQRDATTKFQINDDGDVVITGDDNAELKLQCGTETGNGIIAFLNSSGSTKGNIFYDTDDNFMVFKTNGTASSNERLRISSEGDLTLKNHSPGGGITIDSRDSTSNYSLFAGNGNRVSADYILTGLSASWNSDSVAAIYLKTGADTTNKDDGEITFHTQTSGGNNLAERLRILSDGKMRLIKNGGNANFTISRNESVTSTDQPIGVIDFANNTQHTVNARIMGKTRGTSNVGGDLVVETRADGGSLDERFRITGDGDFGTGGVTPTAQSGKVFHLHGGSNQQRFHMTNNTTGSGATDGFEIIVEQSANVRIRNFEAGNLYFDTGGSNNERIRILSDGRVGINQGSSYNPLTSLDVRHINGTAGTGTVQYLLTICAQRNSARGLEIGTGYPTTGNQNDAGVYYNAKDTESGSYSAQHVWQMGGGNAMVLGYTGKYHLGIGENYPAYPLDISYTDNTAWQNGSIGNGIEVHNKSTTAGTFAGLHLYATGDGANAAASHISCVHTANGTGDLSFANRHAAGGHAERMRLHSDGVLKVHQGVDTNSDIGGHFYKPSNTGYCGTQWTEQGAAFVFYMGELVSSSSSNASSNYVNCYTSHHWGDYPRLIIWAHERYYRCSSTTWTFGCYGGTSPSHSLTQTSSWGSVNGGHGTDNAGSVSVNHGGHVATYSGSQIHRYELTMSNTGIYGYTRWYIGVLKPGARGLYSSAASTSTVDSSSSSGGCTHFKTMSQAQFGPISYLG